MTKRDLLGGVLLCIWQPTGGVVVPDTHLVCDEVHITLGLCDMHTSAPHEQAVTTAHLDYVVRLVFTSGSTELHSRRICLPLATWAKQQLSSTGDPITKMGEHLCMG